MKLSELKAGTRFVLADRAENDTVEFVSTGYKGRPGTVICIQPMDDGTSTVAWLGPATEVVPIDYAYDLREWVKANNVKVGTNVRVKCTPSSCPDDCIYSIDYISRIVGQIRKVVLLSEGQVAINDDADWPLLVPFDILEVVGPQLRPYKDEELHGLIGKTLCTKGGSTRHMVTGASCFVVFIGGAGLFPSQVLKEYVHLDGSPCGVEE